MKEIKLTIPEGCKTVTVKVDGEQVITEFEPKGGKWEPKDGDVVYAKWSGNRSSYKWIFIYKETNADPYSYCDTYAYLGIECDGKPISELHFYEHCSSQELLRPATEAEKQRLFDALAKEGKLWNAEKKCIEDLTRWRAKEEETYYYIGVDAEVEDDSESGCKGDDACYSVGNYFKTREAAEKVAEQIREIFKNSKAE